MSNIFQIFSRHSAINCVNIHTLNIAISHLLIDIATIYIGMYFKMMSIVIIINTIISYKVSNYMYDIQRLVKINHTVVYNCINTNVIYKHAYQK